MEDPQAVLREILAWSGGQPFLTQKLCKLLRSAEGDEGHQPRDWVETVVRSQIIQNWEVQDEPEHLKTIRDRLLHNDRFSPAFVSRLLRLYEQILQGAEVPADHSPEAIELALSGIVTKHEGYLRKGNRICQTIFDQHWVQRQLERLLVEP